MKDKKVRLYSWDANSTVTVQLEETEHWNAAGGDRKFKVYQDGELLGEIESGSGQKSRHLFGNVAHFYKERTFWHSKSAFVKDSYSYRLKHESQADAIRDLIRDRNYHANSPKEAN